LPISFNSVYHIGADLALVILLPAMLVQYVIAAPIYVLVHNRAINIKVSEKNKIDQFLQHSYRRLLLSSIFVSVVAAVLLNLFSGEIMNILGGTDASARILLFASAGSVFLSVFGANSLYMIFLGRVKDLGLIAFVSAFVVAAGGIFAGQYGFENVVMAYVAGAAIAAIASCAVMASTIREAGSWLFSRYV
jgi:hypothetical protein